MEKTLAQGLYEISATPNHRIGEKVVTSGGRTLTYGQAGEALSAGKLSMAPAPKDNHKNIAVAAAAAVGALSVTVTLGATAAVADEYAGGYITVSDATGEGHQYRIGGHPAADLSTALILTLVDPIRVALTTSSEVSLVHNTWKKTLEGVVQTTRAAGVPQVAVTDAYYAWFVTVGPAPVLADQAISLGSDIVPSGSVSGAVIAASGTYGTALVTTKVGSANIMAGVDTEYRPMFLTIE